VRVAGKAGQKKKRKGNGGGEKRFEKRLPIEKTRKGGGEQGIPRGESGGSWLIIPMGLSHKKEERITMPGGGKKDKHSKIVMP